MLWSSEVAWPLTCFHSQRSWPVYGVSGSWGQERASSEGAERRDRTTEGQTEKAGQSGHRNKPPKKKLVQRSNERRLALCITSVQYHKQSVTLNCSQDWDCNSWNIIFYWQLQIVINDVIRSNTPAQQFLCFKNPSCAHLKGTFLFLFTVKHVKLSALFVPDFIIVYNRNHSLFDVRNCNEQKPVCEWSNIHSVFSSETERFNGASW